MDEFKKTIFDPPSVIKEANYEVRTRRTKPYLLVLEGPLKGREFQLNKDILLIGRDKSNDIALEDPLISRRHASIYFFDGKFRIKDLGSTNGTFLNNTRVSESKLNDRDKIQLGRTVIQFFLGDLILK